MFRIKAFGFTVCSTADLDLRRPSFCPGHVPPPPPPPPWRCIISTHATEDGSFASESLLYLLPLLPAGLRRALDFVSLVSHDDVFLLHEAPAPPLHAVGAQRPRTLIGRGVFPTARHVEAGGSRGQPLVLGEAVGHLQGAGAGSLRQAVAGAGPGRPPGLRLGEGQGGLDVRPSTWTGAGRGQGAGREGAGEGLV